MASLMENLMDVLEEEGGYYDALLELSMKKQRSLFQMIYRRCSRSPSRNSFWSIR